MPTSTGAGVRRRTSAAGRRSRRRASGSPVSPRRSTAREQGLHTEVRVVNRCDSSCGSEYLNPGRGLAPEKCTAGVHISSLAVFTANKGPNMSTTVPIEIDAPWYLVGYRWCWCSARGHRGRRPGFPDGRAGPARATVNDLARSGFRRRGQFLQGRHVALTAGQYHQQPERADGVSSVVCGVQRCRRSWPATPNRAARGYGSG